MVRTFRHFASVVAVAAVGTLGLVSPASADGGDINGFWQYHSTYVTHGQCEDAGQPFVPSVADGWVCRQYIMTGYQRGPTTTDWNLHLVFGS